MQVAPKDLPAECGKMHIWQTSVGGFSVLDIGRREFIALVGGAAAAWPLAAHGQQSSRTIPVVGVLWHAGSAAEEDPYLGDLQKAFSDLGYVDGKSIRFEHRFPAEQPERFQILARELVEAKCDALIAVTALAAVELKKLTNTIPIVFVLAADPVGFGLVESLARPGANVTGLSPMIIDLSGKRLGLLKEAVPGVSRVGLLVDITDPFRDRTIAAHQAAAESLGLSLVSAVITVPDDVEPVFAEFVQNGVDGLVWGPGSLLNVLRRRIGKAVLNNRLPAVVAVAEEVPPGLLMSYGQDFPDFFRRSATYINKILKGTIPADLPVEQPTNFKLVLNLRTARFFGLAIPPPLLATADEVIE